MSIERLRQGDAPDTVCFNILVARVYRKQLALLDGRRVLFSIADDLRILAPSVVIGENVEAFPKVAREEAGLATQTAKNIIFAHPSARNGWLLFWSPLPATLLLPCKLTASRMGAL